MPLVEKFIHVAIVSVNANQHTKFQLPSSIIFQDIEGVSKSKLGAADPQTPHSRHIFT